MSRTGHEQSYTVRWPRHMSPASVAPGFLPQLTPVAAQGAKSFMIADKRGKPLLCLDSQTGQTGMWVQAKNEL